MNERTSESLRSTHRPAGRLYRRAILNTPTFKLDLLYGDRQFGWPLAALRAQQELGPVRHALSQMVVAGVMTVFPPWGPSMQGSAQQAKLKKEDS